MSSSKDRVGADAVAAAAGRDETPRSRVEVHGVERTLVVGKGDSLLTLYRVAYAGMPNAGADPEGHAAQLGAWLITKYGGLPRPGTRVELLPLEQMLTGARQASPAVMQEALQIMRDGFSGGARAALRGKRKKEEQALAGPSLGKAIAPGARMQRLGAKKPRGAPAEAVARTAIPPAAPADPRRLLERLGRSISAFAQSGAASVNEAHLFSTHRQERGRNPSLLSTDECAELLAALSPAELRRELARLFDAAGATGLTHVETTAGHLERAAAAAVLEWPLKGAITHELQLVRRRFELLADGPCARDLAERLAGESDAVLAAVLLRLGLLGEPAEAVVAARRQGRVELARALAAQAKAQAVRLGELARQVETAVAGGLELTKIAPEVTKVVLDRARELTGFGHADYEKGEAKTALQAALKESLARWDRNEEKYYRLIMDIALAVSTMGFSTGVSVLGAILTNVGLATAGNVAGALTAMDQARQTRVLASAGFATPEQVQGLIYDAAAGYVFDVVIESAAAGFGGALTELVRKLPGNDWARQAYLEVAKRLSRFGFDEVFDFTPARTPVPPELEDEVQRRIGRHALATFAPQLERRAAALMPDASVEARERALDLFALLTGPELYGLGPREAEQRFGGFVERLREARRRT